VAEFSKDLVELSANLADNSVNSTEFCSSKIFLFLSHINCISAEFSRFSTIFSEFFKMRQNRWEAIFHCSPNFVTLDKDKDGSVSIGEKEELRLQEREVGLPKYLPPLDLRKLKGYCN
jgi:hypothetical protein